MRSRILRLTAALAVLALLALSAAACGGGDDGGGVATVSGGATATTTRGQGKGGSKDPQAAALEFARCMRANGVEDFPDPKAGQGGEILIQPEDGVDPGNPKFRNATEACRGKLGDGGVARASDDPAMQASMLEFAKCMRANGVEDFPDPQVDAKGAGVIVGPDSGVDVNSPSFKAAEKACRSKLRPPSGGEGR